MGALGLLLLDRDGVINQDLPQGVRRREDFHLIPGSLKAIADFKKKGVRVAVVSNQALVGRGELSPQGLDALHQFLQDELALLGAQIDHFFVCTDKDPSARRKPAPGMLLEAMALFQASPLETVMVGDDLRDFEAARGAGCSFVLVRTGKGERHLKEGLLTRLPQGVTMQERVHLHAPQASIPGPMGVEKFFAIAANLEETVSWLVP